MQTENDPPAVEDKPEMRYQLRRLALTKNKTDVGCHEWQPLDGHIWLLLLAKPATSTSKYLQPEPGETPEHSSEGVYGYNVSGLILGPVEDSMGTESMRYERLARLTNIGLRIRDYRDLEKMVQQVVIV
jgi:hypothetical protein